MKNIKPRAISALLTFSLLAPMSVSALAGDISQNSSLDSTDIVMLKQHILNCSILSQNKADIADMNSDSQINICDVIAMERALLNSQSQANYIDVDTIDELFVAVRNAKPGDVIRVASGTYDYTTYQGAQKIDTSAEGTADAPITLTAADPSNPPVLTGTSAENGYVLQIKGDYWILENLKITTSQKGIVLDNSNNSIIRNCEVYNIGSEGIALRDGSSDCLVQNCDLHDIGVVTPGYGEGVYIGSSYTVSGFDYYCDNNVVDGCTFKNIAAEHVDVKEYTTGTEIRNCIFDGTGMTGANYAGSFVDIAGNDCYVHDNVGYRNGNPKIVAAFEIHEQVSGWGYHSVFENNTLYMDREYGEENTSRRMYIVDGWFADFTVKNIYVDYGNGLIAADASTPQYFNSDYVTFE